MEHGTGLAITRSISDDPNCTNHYFLGGIDNTYQLSDLTSLSSGAFHFFIVFIAMISWGLIEVWM